MEIAGSIAAKEEEPSPISPPPEEAAPVERGAMEVEEYTSAPGEAMGEGASGERHNMFPA